MSNLKDVYHVAHYMNTDSQVPQHARATINVPNSVQNETQQYDVALSQISLNSDDIPEVIVPIENPAPEPKVEMHDVGIDVYARGLAPETYWFKLRGGFIWAKRLHQGTLFERSSFTESGNSITFEPRYFPVGSLQSGIQKQPVPGSEELFTWDQKNIAFQVTAEYFARVFFGQDVYSSEASWPFQKSPFKVSEETKSWLISPVISTFEGSLIQNIFAVPWYIAQILPSPCWRKVTQENDGPAVFQVINRESPGIDQYLFDPLARHDYAPVTEDPDYNLQNALPVIVSNPKTIARGIFITNQALSTAELAVHALPATNVLAFYTLANNTRKKEEKLKFSIQDPRKGERVALADIIQSDRTFNLFIYWVDTDFNIFPFKVAQNNSVLLQIIFMIEQSVDAVQVPGQEPGPEPEPLPPYLPPFVPPDPTGEI